MRNGEFITVSTDTVFYLYNFFKNAEDNGRGFMKKVLSVLFMIFTLVCIGACSKIETKKDIELMGAGDRIHDTYTFANVGVSIQETGKNTYKISGSVDKLENDAIKNEFDIDEGVTHVVAIKLSANGKEVDKEKGLIKINGVRSYDAEHLNGSDYTFIVLEAVSGTSVSIEASWNGTDKTNYIVVFDENLNLK